MAERPAKYKVQARPKRGQPCQQTSVQAPKTAPQSQVHLKTREERLRRQKEAQDVQNEIAQFEANKKRLASHNLSPSVSGGLNLDGQKPVLMSNSQYIQQIRKRMEEDAAAHQQRDKRLYRFLEEQSKAREVERNAKEEEYLVRRLTRPTKAEQRMVAQLLQIRRQKEVFVKNHEFREMQIQKRREKDLLEAQEREAVR